MIKCSIFLLCLSFLMASAFAQSPPADAFHVAYKALLEKAFGATKDGEQRRQLEKALSLLQSGRGEVPDYKPVNAH